MTKEFLFLCGRIRALEAKLLTHAQIDRMVGAKSPEEAFRVLTELQYAEDFDEATRPQDFFKIIKRGLLETKSMITSGTDNDSAFEFIWKEYDLSNLKRALKLKLLDKATGLGSFSESDGFAFLGSLTVQEIEAAIFQGETHMLPREYREALIESEKQFVETGAFRSIEFILDRAHFDFLKRVANSHRMPILKELLKLLADTTNLRSVARCVLIWNEKMPEEAVLPHGTIDTEMLVTIDSLQSLKAVFHAHPFFERFEKTLEEKVSPEELLIRLERQMHSAKIEWLSEQEAGDIGTIIVPMTYFQKRIRNASRIRFVMAAKFYGIEPEKIYETLKHF
jgi:vacuolar-type H+-ATPase subunit C/Vma6